MTCQKVCKQDRDDIKVMVSIQSPIPTFLHEKSAEIGFVYLHSLLYHSYLVCMLFGMPSLHLFIFNVVFFITDNVW